jgi:hypothetical protein
MQATKFCEFGFGDIATWPPFAGHPHDPRAPDPDDDDATADVINDVRQFLNMAEVAAAKGDWKKAKQALVEARMSLEELVGVGP